MKINKLYIRGFGKIENFDLDLSKNINVIYGPNESGKSTLMGFIKAVLFGLKGGRTDKEGLAAEIKRYRPWSNSRYGGYVNFELDNYTAYRIDRDFENNSVKLYDSEFNEITAALSGSKDGRGIAEKLIGVNEGLFEKTVFIRQLGTKIDTSSSKDLIDRISNIGQSGFEDISYKKACTALKEALKSQVGTERSYTRPLDIISKRLGELRQLQIKIMQEKESRLALMDTLKELDADIAIIQQKEKLLSLAAEFSSVKEKLLYQRDKQDELQYLNDGITLVKTNIKRLAEDKETLTEELQKAAEQKAGLEKNLEEAKHPGTEKDLEGLKKLIKLCDICGVVTLTALLVTVWCALSPKIFSIYISGIPSTVFIAIVIFRISKQTSFVKLDKLKAVRSERVAELQRQLESVLGVKAIADNQLTGLDERLNIEQSQYEQQLKRLESMRLTYRRKDLDELERRADELSAGILKLLEEVSEKLPEGEATLIENVLEDIKLSPDIELNRLRNFYSEQLQQKKIERAGLDYQVKKNSSGVDAEAVELEMNRLTHQKKALEQRGEALSIAMATLEEASKEVQKKLLPVMNSTFTTTFENLTSQRYKDTRAGDQLNIMLHHPDSDFIVPVSALSNGTIDQLYLALRIAVTETVFNIKERLPLILDEPFAQYDDKRTENALKLISELGKKQQVIIFTCKQREIEMIGDLGLSESCKICSLT